MISQYISNLGIDYMFTHEVEGMICVAQGANHGPAPIHEEGLGKSQRSKRQFGTDPWSGLVRATTRGL